MSSFVQFRRARRSSTSSLYMQLLSSLANDLDHMLNELCSTTPYDRLPDTEVIYTRYGKSLRRHFKYVLLVQIFNGLLLLTVMFYITFYFGGGGSPIAFYSLMIATFAMIFVFTYHSELYNQQDEDIGSTLFEIPWYTFNKSNRATFLIFAMNVCPVDNYFTGGGIFLVNFNLFIWMIHKVINLLTLMSRMVDN